MIKAHIGIASKSIVCLTVISAALCFGTTEIDIYMDITRPQKYLVRGETTSDDFLFCRGEYSNDAAVKGLRVDLTLERDSACCDPHVPMAPNADARYVFKCEPPMPLEKEKLMSVSSAYCTLGIVDVSADKDAGQYRCQVKGQSSTKAAQTHLGVWDKFILNTTQQNPAIVNVNETDDVVLKCRINRQENLEGLTVRWQHSGSDLWDKIRSAETVCNCGGCSFDLELKSASRKDAGEYQCVVVAQNGDRLIDSGRKITLVVNDISHVVGPVGITSLKFEGGESGCFSENEIVTLKCTVTGNTLLTVYDPGENAVGAGMGEVEIPVNTSLAKDGIYKCRGVGGNANKELEFCVRVESVFRQNASDNATCLAEGSLLTLCCTASAGINPVDIEILTSNGSSLASNDPMKRGVCVDVQKSDNYSCLASTPHSNSRERLSVTNCTDGDTPDPSGSSIAVIISVSGLVYLGVLIIARVILWRCRRKKVVYIVNPSKEQTENANNAYAERDPLMVLQNEEEPMELASSILSFDWGTLWDFCRAIDPPFKKGESFIDRIKEKIDKENRSNNYWATRCLETWRKEHPKENFWRAVCDALRKVNSLDASLKSQVLNLERITKCHFGHLPVVQK